MLTAGLVTIATLMILIIKLPRPLLLKLLGIDVVVDIVVTFALSWLFAGTYSGLMTAVFAGLFFSIVLGLLRKLMGYEYASWYEGRIVWQRVRGVDFKRLLQ